MEENNKKNVSNLDQSASGSFEENVCDKTLNTKIIVEDTARLAAEQVGYFTKDLKTVIGKFNDEANNNIKKIADLIDNLSDAGYSLYKLPDEIDKTVSKHIKDIAPEVAKQIIDATLDGFNRRLDESMAKAHKLLEKIGTYEKLKFKRTLIRMIGTVILTTSVAAVTTTLILRGYPNKIIVDAGEAAVKIDNSYVDVMGVSALTEANALFKETTRELKAKKDKQMIENYKARQKKLEKDDPDNN